MSQAIAGYRRLPQTLALMAMMVGCATPNLKPTVSAMKDTLVFLRADYAGGKVTFHPDADKQAKSVSRRLRLIDAAVSNADTALKEEGDE